MSIQRPRVLVVGAGGREHAIGWALARSPRRPALFFAPGNPGTSEVGENLDVAVSDLQGIARAAAQHAVDLVVVGPEGPLVDGLADRLAAAGIPVVGPSAAAARIEGSKAWAKAFMTRHGIPTARSASFETGREKELRAYVEAHALPVVLKADGLAAGKGVVVATTREEARRGLDDLLAGGLGEAAGVIVVEEFLDGEEASVFAISDGVDFVTLSPAQDHKRIGDGDTGPNTGGMGAYAPAPIVTPAVMQQVRERVIAPTLRGMASEGHPYVGVLYAGLMIGPEGPMVVEFNCRLGDPETQVVLPLVDGDLLDLFERAAGGSLAGVEVTVKAGHAACVVLAAPGYPGSYPAGSPISGVDAVPDDVIVFQAGTRRDDDGRLITSGGRVLGVVGTGVRLEDALSRAYAGVAAVSFDGMQFRSDIGRRGLAAEAGAVVANR